VLCDISMTSKCGSVNTVYFSYIKHRVQSGAAEGEEKWGVEVHGERAERETVTGSGGRAPSGVQGQSPWSGGLQKLKAFLFQDVTQSNQGKRFRFLFLLSFKVII